MSQELTEKLQTQIQTALEEVIDPELGIDIVNLGLVYEVQMTLTTIGCPLADVIINDVKQALLKIDQIKEVKVELVWYPAWDPSRMSRYARIALGVKL